MVERTKKSRVTQVTQSPLNPKRWMLTLNCGHILWVTCVRRPLAVAKPCAVCKGGKT